MLYIIAHIGTFNGSPLNNGSRLTCNNPQGSLWFKFDGIDDDEDAEETSVEELGKFRAELEPRSLCVGIRLCSREEGVVVVPNRCISFASYGRLPWIACRCKGNYQLLFN